MHLSILLVGRNPFVSQVNFFIFLNVNIFRLLFLLSQSLRKSGQFLQLEPRIIKTIVTTSQSLRKSGQFLLTDINYGIGTTLNGRNPFVSQVNFFNAFVLGAAIFGLLSQSLRKSGQFLPILT